MTGQGLGNLRVDATSCQVGNELMPQSVEVKYPSSHIAERNSSGFQVCANHLGRMVDPSARPQTFSRLLVLQPFPHDSSQILPHGLDVFPSTLAVCGFHGHSRQVCVQGE